MVADCLAAVFSNVGEQWIDLAGRGGRCRQRWLAVLVGQQNERFRFKLRLRETARDVDNLGLGQRTGQLPGGVVERLRALLAGLRFTRLLFEAGGQLAGNQAGDQHHGESHQVLDVFDGQRKARRNEKDVEEQDAEN